MDRFFAPFRFCPSCGRRYGAKDLSTKNAVFACGGCSFRFWQNSKPAVGLLIPHAGDPSHLLVTRRAIEPRKGKLDVPGGFVGLHEDPRAAAEREAREELGRGITIDRLFHVDRERYDYRGALYSVLVLYYLARPIASVPRRTDVGEIAWCDFIDARRAASGRGMAFKADVRAFKKYVKLATDRRTSD